MSEQRTGFRGVEDLGRLMDERTSRDRGNLSMQHGTGAAPPVPIGGDDSTGGGAESGEPIMPEAYVETLRVAGQSEQLSGEIELVGAGDIVLEADAESNRIEVQSPAYTATDGIQRLGGEFSCDQSVVRTLGNQTIGGMKTFEAFPCTPEAPPAQSYEVANKLYVDSSLPETLWERSGQAAITTKADDSLDLQRSVLSAVVTSSMSGDGAARFVLNTAGSMSWGDGAGPPDTTLTRSDAGRLELGDGNYMRLPEYLEMAEITAVEAPVAPSGYCRWHVLGDGRAYLVDSAGCRHDLAAQHKQVSTGWDLADASAAGEKWQAAKYPESAVSAAAVSVQTCCSFDFTDGELDSAYGRWSVTADGTTDLQQSQVAIGVPFRKYGDGTDRDGNCRIVVKARMRISQADSLDNLYFFLNDISGNRVSADVLGSMSDATWGEVTLAAAGTDVSSWDSALRAGIWARGDSALAGTDTWTVDLEWISIEQWCG